MGNIFAIEQGVKVACAVTGFKGTVTARMEHDSGCLRYEVTPKAVKNKVEDARWIDEIHLLASVPKAKKKSPPGGPHNAPPARSHP